MRIFAAGHSTFRLTIGDLTVFTDPWFTTNGLFYHLFMRRIYPLGIEPESINRCDAMLVSHNHPDHFSHHALVLARKLGSTIIGPPGVIRRARRHGISNCHELQPGERCDLAGMQITAVPAVHPLSRSAIGFFIESEKNVYFSGDTRFDWRIVDALRDKPVDVAFLQVSCTFHTLLWGSNGMDINYADELARAVRPKCVIPMHFDCIHKYLDIVTDRRVSEHSLDIEDALNSLKERLSANDIDCILLFAGNEIEL